MNMQAHSQSDSGKILIAYFSHSGNTQIIAEKIQSAAGGDIFEIRPVKNYPSGYNAVVDQAKKEIDSNYKPALETQIADMESYDIIFVGSPDWWSTIAPPVASFLSGCNLSGKIIIPFITHEGSAMGHSVADIKRLSPGSTILEGLPVRGGAVKKANDDVTKWLRKIKIVN
jgi:flavodoxin